MMLARRPVSLVGVYSTSRAPAGVCDRGRRLPWRHYHLPRRSAGCALPYRPQAVRDVCRYVVRRRRNVVQEESRDQGQGHGQAAISLHTEIAAHPRQAADVLSVSEERCRCKDEAARSAAAYELHRGGSYHRLLRLEGGPRLRGRLARLTRRPDGSGALLHWPTVRAAVDYFAKRHEQQLRVHAIVWPRHGSDDKWWVVDVHEEGGSTTRQGDGLKWTIRNKRC
eukprot:4421563-Prymnesium_polylepis.2